jgi:hypothetical protein
MQHLNDATRILVCVLPVYPALIGLWCLHTSKDLQLPIKARNGMRGYLKTANRCLKVYFSLAMAELR